MKKKITVLLTLAFVLSLLATPAIFAQESESVEKISQKETMEEAISAKRKAAKAEMEAKREEIQTQRLEIRKEMEAKREEMKVEMEAKREEMKAALVEFKDQTKVEIIERIDSRLASQNEKLTDRLLGHLEKISEILDRIQDRADALIDSDTTAVTKAIKDARTAISDAEEIIAEQSSNEYVATIEDEATAKDTISTVVESFRADMKSSIDAVKSARDVAKMAGEELRSLAKPEATAGDATTEDVTSDPIMDEK